MTRNSILYRQPVITELAHSPAVLVHLLLKRNVSEDGRQTALTHKPQNHHVPNREEAEELSSALAVPLGLRTAFTSSQFEETFWFRGLRRVYYLCVWALTVCVSFSFSRHLPLICRCKGWDFASAVEVSEKVDTRTTLSSSAPCSHMWRLMLMCDEVVFR